MKNRFIIHITIVLIFTITLAIAAGCSHNLNGSHILSKDQVKDRGIVTMKITYFDPNNRLKSPVATLTSGNQDGQSYIQEFREIVMISKGVSLESDNKFSPISDSSHYIEAIFDNDYKLDFYYSEENNWLIWSEIIDQDEQKIVEYHFLSPKTSVKEWLSAIKPLATIDE